MFTRWFSVLTWTTWMNKYLAIQHSMTAGLSPSSSDHGSGCDVKQISSLGKYAVTLKIMCLLTYSWVGQQRKLLIDQSVIFSWLRLLNNTFLRVAEQGKFKIICNPLDTVIRRIESIPWLLHVWIHYRIVGLARQDVQASMLETFCTLCGLQDNELQQQTHALNIFGMLLAVPTWDSCADTGL